MTLRPPPSTCPVCGDALHTTRLSCDTCDTELTGHFAGCEYCALGPDDRRILSLFLGSRGNVKEVERALGVSYPTARARVDAVLEKLGYLSDEQTDTAPGSAPAAHTHPAPPAAPRAPAPPAPPAPPSAPPGPPQASGPSAESSRRLDLLEKLARGEVSVDDALGML